MTTVPYIQMIGRGLRPFQPWHSDPCDEWPPEMFGYESHWVRAKRWLDERPPISAHTSMTWDLGRCLR